MKTVLTGRSVVFESLKMTQTKHFTDGRLNTIIVNSKLSFLWHLLWDKKHVGECVNKTKYFYVHIFNIS